MTPTTDTRRIVLVRHGESVSNRNMTITGRSDAALTRNGSREAKRTSRYIKRRFGPQTDIILTSPLSRAFDTALCISRSLNVPVSDHDSLMETDFGRWEGKTKADLPKEPEWDVYIKDPFHFSFPEGEAVQEVKRRTLLFKDRLLLREDWNCAVIVSHYTPIVFLILSAIGNDDAVRSPFRIDNASISVIEIREDSELVSMLNYKP